MVRKCTGVLALLGLSFAEGGTAYGAGFSVFTQGAGPMGVANASVAHAEGLASIFYNPALQLEFEGINSEAGLTVLGPEKEVDSSITGQSYSTEDHIYTPVHGAVSYRFSENGSLALTINNSFGLGSEYPEDTPFRYLATNSELTTWDINPSIAYRFLERLVVSAGLRGVSADTTLEKMIPLQSYGLADGRQKFEADGTGYGWNIGATLALNDQWSVGASYRSEVEIDLSGDVRFDLPAGTPAPLAAVFPSTSADAKFTLPAQFFAGVAFRPTNRWVVEAAAMFEEYSSYDNLRVEVAQPIAGQTTMVIPKNWSNVWGYLFGASYLTDSGYRLSAGYLYEENPVPDETFEPGTSGLDKHTLTAGIGGEFRDIGWRISYAYDIYEDRDIENSGVDATMNGTHSQKNQSLAISFAYHF